jgi:hypothetical protein
MRRFVGIDLGREPVPDDVDKVKQTGSMEERFYIADIVHGSQGCRYIARRPGQGYGGAPESTAWRTCETTSELSQTRFSPQCLAKTRNDFKR